jgi:hypothetical protein
MKRAIFSLLAVAILVGLTGCARQIGRRPWACMGGSCAQAPENCGESCNGDTCNDPARCRRSADGPGFFKPHCLCKGRGSDGTEVVEDAGPAAGPATGAVTYPYYTTRGPRDFLAKNPSSIGP